MEDLSPVRRVVTAGPAAPVPPAPAARQPETPVPGPSVNLPVQPQDSADVSFGLERRAGNQRSAATHRHSAARQMLPIQPQWLVEAFGLVQLDPAGMHEGPYQRSTGQLEIRSRIASPDGDLTKVLVMHDRFGWIQEQHWYDPRGQLIASVFASQHQYEPAAGVSLPHVIDVRLPPPALSLRINVQTYAVNQLYADPAQLWAMPAFEGYPQIDLAAAAPQSLPSPSAPPAYPAPAVPPNAFPQTGYRLNYRGYTARRPGFAITDVDLR